MSAEGLRLNAQLQKTFEMFLEHHPPHRLSTNLRRMLLEFLMSEGGIEAEYLQDLLYDLDGLFELLEAVGGSGGAGLNSGALVKGKR